MGHAAPPLREHADSLAAGRQATLDSGVRRAGEPSRRILGDRRSRREDGGKVRRWVFRDAAQFIEHMEHDTGEAWPLTLGGSAPRREEDNLLNFVAYQRWLLGLSHSTVAGKLSGIRLQHIIDGHENPLEGKARLKAAMKKLKKLRGDSHRKLPVTADMLTHIKSTLDLSGDRDVVTWAALNFGCFFCLRQSEYLAEGDVFDSKRALCGWKVLPPHNGHPRAGWERADALAIMIEVSKTDQDRRGCTRAVHASGGELFVVEAYKRLRRMQGRARDPFGPLLEAPGGWVVSRGIISDTPKRRQRSGTSPRATSPHIRSGSGAPRCCSPLACRTRKCGGSDDGSPTAGGDTCTSAASRRETWRRRWRHPRAR